MTSPEVANVLKKFVKGHPLRWSTRQGVKNRKDFETLQALALKDMKAFRSKFNDMKAKRNEDNYNQQAVRDVLTKAGLSKHLTDEHKIEGDETMNESYKDKFNAAMKKFGINSLDDLKTDADKKKFFKHVDSIHKADHEEVKEETVNEIFTQMQMKKAIGIARKSSGQYTKAYNEIEKIKKGLGDEHIIQNALKKANEDFREGHNCEQEHPGKSHDVWIKSKEKNEMKDLEPDVEKINAMVKDPHKSKEGNPKDDLLAQWSDADVRPDVKEKGGADMAKVKDKAPISASYESKKYHETRPGSIQDAVMQMQVNETKNVTIKVKELSALIETYLNKGGVSHNLSPVIAEKEISGVLPLQAVREFIGVYNRHFLTNFKAEEFVVEKKIEYAYLRFRNKNEANRAARTAAELAGHNTQMSGKDIEIEVSSGGAGENLTIDGGKNDVSKIVKELVRLYRAKVVDTESVDMRESSLESVDEMINPSLDHNMNKRFNQLIDSAEALGKLLKTTRGMAQLMDKEIGNRKSVAKDWADMTKTASQLEGKLSDHMADWQDHVETMNMPSR